MRTNELTWERRQRLLVNVILTRLSIRLQTEPEKNEPQPHVIKTFQMNSPANLFGYLILH